MANWFVLAAEVACVLLALVHLGVPEAIMCVRCQSTKDTKEVHCEKNPPEPTRCPKQSPNKQYCMTARELHKNGTLKAFIRDCSTTKMDDECKILADTGNRESPHKICYSTCDWDGCNPAPPAASPATLPALLVIFLGCQALLQVRRQVWSS